MAVPKPHELDIIHVCQARQSIERLSLHLFSHPSKLCYEKNGKTIVQSKKI